MRIVVALLALIVTCWTQAQEIFGDEKAAYVLSPARVVSDSFVTYASFSDDGKRLIYARINPNHALEPEKGVADWFVYDRLIHRSFPIRLKGVSEATEIQVMGDGKNLRLSDRTVPELNGFYNLESGRFQPFAIKHDRIIYAGLHAQTPFMLIEGEQDAVGVIYPFSNVWFFKPSKSWKIGAPSSHNSQEIRIVCASEGRPVQWRMCTVSKATGAVTYGEIKQGDFDVLFGVEDPTRFEMSHHDSGWKVSIEPTYDGKPKKPFTKLDERAYVCSERAQNVLFEWESDVVAYCDAGVLLIREIRAIDHKRAIELTNQRRHKETLQAAKQVGIALLIYAADADDVLPTGEGFIGKLLPYTRNANLLSNFTYTFGGGPIDKIKDPASTELGFVQGDGGRAVVYADGHAKWIQDKL